MNAFERQVSGVITGLMGPVRPVDDLAVFNSIPTATQSPMWRLQPMFSATKFVVAGVIVALFGGFLLVGVLTQQSGDVAPATVGSASPEATPSTLFELPAVIPDGIESGSIDTPLGKARWVHLTGNRDTLPVLVDVDRAISWRCSAGAWPGERVRS